MFSSLRIIAREPLASDLVGNDACDVALGAGCARRSKTCYETPYENVGLTGGKTSGSEKAVHFVSSLFAVWLQVALVNFALRTKLREQVGSLERSPFKIP